jgi:putative transposase
VMMYVRLQKFVSIHASVFNHFNKVRHLNSRDTYKVQFEAALVEWQQLCAA